MKIRDRIKELRRVRASQLEPHPRNWRTHPVEQRNALRGLLAEVGYADALLVRELAGGGLQIVDGHLRAETTPDAMVPVLVLDVDESEAEKILLSHDPVAAMAQADADQLAALIADVETDNEALRSMLENLAAEASSPDLLSGDAERPAVNIPESYQVVVECRDEQDQQSVYERLRREGYRCRVLTL